MADGARRGRIPPGRPARLGQAASARRRETRRSPRAGHRWRRGVRRALRRRRGHHRVRRAGLRSRSRGSRDRRRRPARVLRDRVRRSGRRRVPRRHGSGRGVRAVLRGAARRSGPGDGGVLPPQGQGDSGRPRRTSGQLGPGAGRQGRTLAPLPGRCGGDRQPSRLLRGVPHRPRRRRRGRVLALGRRGPARSGAPRLHRPPRLPARPAPHGSRREATAAAALPLSPGRRVPGHRSASGGDRLLPLRAPAGGRHVAAGRARAGQALRGGRPQAVHLPLPPSGHRHVRRGQGPRAVTAGRKRPRRGHQPELPHDAGGPGLGQQRVRRPLRRRAGARSPAGIPVGGAIPAAGRRLAGDRAARRALRRDRRDGGGGAARRSTCGRGASRGHDGRRRRALAGPRARRGIGSGAPPAAALGRCGHPVPYDHRSRDA